MLTDVLIDSPYKSSSRYGRHWVKIVVLLNPRLLKPITRGGKKNYEKFHTKFHFDIHHNRMRFKLV